jgi:hypothetical protein
VSGSTVFSEPRPEPSHLIPALVGGLVLAIALPVFLVAGWNLAGWGLATVLYVAIHALNLLLAQLRERTSDLAASGVQAFGLFFKSLGLLVVLLATAVANPHLAVAAALTYALAYTAELGLSLVVYFGAAR